MRLASKQKALKEIGEKNRSKGARGGRKPGNRHQNHEGQRKEKRGTLETSQLSLGLNT